MELIKNRLVNSNSLGFENKLGLKRTKLLKSTEVMLLQTSVILSLAKAVSSWQVFLQSIERNIHYADLCHKILPLDLSYITHLFDTPIEQSEIIQLAKNELKSNLENLMEAVESKKAFAIKQAAHKLNSKLVVLSIPLLTECKFVEEYADRFNETIFIEKYQFLKMNCFIRLWQLNNI